MHSTLSYKEDTVSYNGRVQYTVSYNSQSSLHSIIQQPELITQYHTTAWARYTVSYNSQSSLHSIIQQPELVTEYHTTACAHYIVSYSSLCSLHKWLKLKRLGKWWQGVEEVKLFQYWQKYIICTFKKQLRSFLKM